MGRPSIKSHIIYESDDVIVVNKPPMIATLEDRASEINLLAMAREYCREAQVCHRLDKETSGALIIAKRSDVYRHVSMQFQNREVKKVYHAVCDGIREFSDELVDAPIRKLGNGLVCIDRYKGRDAQTYVTTLRAYRKHMLVECRPVSGRMHQIRIHLSHLGTPITGDTAYGGQPFYLSSVKAKYNLKKDEEERPLIQRLALHALSISFTDTKGNAISAEAPYPKDFSVLLKQLEKHS